mgnify:FL=1
MIKLSFCLTRKSHLSRSEFQDYWINKHAPLVKSVSKDLKILKYDQIHCQNFDYLDTLRRARVPEGDFPHDYDGIAELYWGSWNIFKKINNEKKSRDAARLLWEDESKFINFDKSPQMFSNIKEIF